MGARLSIAYYVAHTLAYISAHYRRVYTYFCHEPLNRANRGSRFAQIPDILGNRQEQPSRCLITVKQRLSDSQLT